MLEADWLPLGPSTVTQAARSPLIRSMDRMDTRTVRHLIPFVNLQTNYAYPFTGN